MAISALINGRFKMDGIISAEVMAIGGDIFNGNYSSNNGKV